MKLITSSIFKKRIALFAMAMLPSVAVHSANTSDMYLNTIADNFVTVSSNSMNVDLGSWQFISIIDCFTTPGKSCFGNNPSSPYGAPYFNDSVTGTLTNAFHLNPNEAVVIIFRTPPKVRYFGFTQYLVDIGASSDSMPVLGSLSDAISMLRINTSGSLSAGVNVNNQYSAIVWTNDANVYSQARSYLISAGLASSSINLMSIPTSLPRSTGNPKYTLNFGYTATSDTFGMFLRMALPDVQSDLDNYISENPYRLYKVSFKQAKTSSPYAAVAYKSEISGIVESSNLQTALNNLASDVAKNYSSSYNLVKQKTAFITRTGWSCIQNDIGCQGDTHDALYSLDIPTAVNFSNSDTDFVIVVGVNHQKTGKATYLSHAVYDTAKFAGIVAVADPLFTSDSAMYHIGSLATSAKLATYQNLYAYMIAYNCMGRQYCVEIPAPTDSNPVGLAKGAPFLLMGRKYVDPNTGVRPSSSEIIMHQVFIGSKK